MTLCTCTDRPMCEQVCSAPADYSVWMKPWGKRGESFKFMCDGHFREYREAWSKPLKFIDQPETTDLDDDWKPSLREHVLWGDMKFEFANRGNPNVLRLTNPRTRKSPYTPEELKKIEAWCLQIREMHRQRRGEI